MMKPYGYEIALKSMLICILSSCIAFTTASCRETAALKEIPPTNKTLVNQAESTTGRTSTEKSNWEVQAEYQEILDIVWNKVNETFYDPDFNGVDWEQVYDEYLPRIIHAEDGKDFIILLNQMCFELGVSHFAVLPSDSNDLVPILSTPGSVGMDIRFIEDQAVITKVEKGSPAALAGIRPGFVILNVDGVPVEDAEHLIEIKVPPYNERKNRGRVLNMVRSKFYGEPGQEISIVYLDADDQIHEITLEMAARGEVDFDGEIIPAMYVDFETRYLEGGIAYIQIDAFLPPILDGVLEAIEDMRDAPGMIIDIRGNPGGVFPVRRAIASQFFQDRTLLWRYVTRPGLEIPDFEHEAYSEPPEQAYLGPVVVLVDVLSESSSEEFSGALSANQRATVIGTRTSGSVLVSYIESLPYNLIFSYPYAQTRTSDGTVLEDRGVIPDIEVLLDRQDLLHGIDTQLEAAIQFILNP